MRMSGTLLGYEPTGPGRDAPVIDAMRRLLARQYPRFGYQRIRTFLKREGHEMSWERAHRLLQDAGLQLPQPAPSRPEFRRLY
jgi:putative transposase